MAKAKATKATTPAAPIDPATAPWRIGTSYLIRTVAYYALGRLTWVGPQELVLEEASWIADTGRFSTALARGALNEIEPIPGPLIVGRGSIVDAAAWTHALPLEVK